MRAQSDDAAVQMVTNLTAPPAPHVTEPTSTSPSTTKPPRTNPPAAVSSVQPGVHPGAAAHRSAHEVRRSTGRRWSAPDHSRERYAAHPTSMAVWMTLRWVHQPRDPWPSMIAT